MVLGTKATNVFVLPDLNLQKAFLYHIKTKQKSPSSGSEDQSFWEVPDKERLTHLLRKGCNTQLLNIRYHWT